MNISNKKTVELMENRLVLVGSKGKEAGQMGERRPEVLINIIHSFQF